MNERFKLKVNHLLEVFEGSNKICQSKDTILILNTSIMKSISKQCWSSSLTIFFSFGESGHPTACWNSHGRKSSFPVC